MTYSRLIYSSILTALIILVMIASPVRGQMKIGYMNPQTVLDTLPAKQQVENQLNAFIEEKRGELEQQTVKFQQRIASLQKQAQNASQSQQQRLEDSAAAINQRLRQYRRKVQQQIQQQRAQLLKPIYSRIDQAIQTVAERNNLEFVLNKGTSNGQDIIYYADARQMNITDEVIDELLKKQQ